MRWEVFDANSGHIERRSRSEQSAICHQLYLKKLELRYYKSVEKNEKYRNPWKETRDWRVRLVDD